MGNTCIYSQAALLPSAPPGPLWPRARGKWCINTKKEGIPQTWEVPAPRDRSRWPRRSCQGQIAPTHMVTCELPRGSAAGVAVTIHRVHSGSSWACSGIVQGTRLFSLLTRFSPRPILCTLLPAPPSSLHTVMCFWNQRQGHGALHIGATVGAAREGSCLGVGGKKHGVQSWLCSL